MTMLIKKICFFTFILFIGSQTLLSQVDTSFSTPHAAVYNHLYFLQNDSYDPVEAAKSFGKMVGQEDAIQKAIKLKQILDGGGHFVYMSQIPEENGYTDSLSGKSLYYLFPKVLPEIYVEKSANEWFYSKESFDAINKLHKKTYPFGTDYLLGLAPANSSFKVLGLYLWQYFGILALILIGAILFLLLKYILRPILRRIGKLSIHINLEDDKLLNKTTRILSLLLVFILIKYLLPILQLPVKWTFFSIKAIDIIITVYIALLLLRVLDYLLNYFKGVTEKTESKMDDQLMPIISQMFKLIVIIGTLIQILHLINVNVTALIAGISIGGLALALAAKDTVSNLIGSLMVFMDKPFQIGDYIEVDGFGGTVKEVGFRSTRIQTKDTSVISIPNGKIANTALVNKGIRVFRLFETTLGVTYDTPPYFIEVFVEGLIKLIKEHPRVMNEDYYINLTGLGASSLDIIFRVYLDTTNYKEELEIKQDLILTILNMANELGVRFAFPSTTVYVEQFPGQKDLIPEYGDSKQVVREKVDSFLENWKANK